MVFGIVTSTTYLFYLYSLFYVFDSKYADLMFYFFYEAKCARPKNRARHRGFVRLIGISTQFGPV